MEPGDWSNDTQVAQTKYKELEALNDELWREIAKLKKENPDDPKIENKEKLIILNSAKQEHLLDKFRAKRAVDPAGNLPAGKRSRMGFLVPDFSVNGALDPTNSGQLVIPRTALVEKLGQIVNTHKLLRITGTRASGKTTLMTLFQVQFKDEVNVVYLTAENLRDAPEFWHNVWLALQNTVVKDHFPEFDTAEKFSHYISGTIRPPEKRIILVWDEFDFYTGVEARWAELLHVFRGLKTILTFNEKAENPPLLRGIIIIGAHRASQHPQLFQKNLSPFNTASDIGPQDLLFTLEEVQQLFLEVAQNRSIVIDDAAVSDVFTVSGGHPGMVNLCGKYMTQHCVTPTKSQVTLRDWKDSLSSGSFFTAMINRGAFTAFAQNAQRYPANFKDRLLTLTTSGLTTIDLDGEIAQEGYADILVESNKTQLKCELVRQLLIRQILVPLNVNCVPPRPFEIVELLKRILPLFSASHVNFAFQHSHKKAVTSHAADHSYVKYGADVPEEAVYQVEFFRVVSSWAGLGHAVHNEVNASTLSLDFLYVVKDPGNVIVEKHAIELAASTTDHDLDEHANRGYKNKIGATDEVILHFTPVLVDRGKLKFSAGRNNVPVIHIHHSRDGKTYTIIWGKTQKESAVVKTVS